MNKVFLFIRVITVPHIFALLLLTLVYIVHPQYFASIWFLLAGILFLTVLPLLAYPLQKHIARYKDRGREGQRKLAMIFSSLGYVLGTAVVFIFETPLQLRMIFVEYLLCGIAILVSDKVFKLKASGHACGIVGPVAMLIYLQMYIPAIVGALLIIPVYVSSIKTKQHTPTQLIIGSAIPIIMLVIDHLIFHLL